MSKLSLPIREFVTSFCKRAFPTRDFSRGSAINDLVINAFSAILQPIRHEIDTIKINQSVASWQVMSREAMDALAANWGKYRQSGSRATGQVRLYFESATDYQINYIQFYSTDGVNYVLASPISISANELLKNKRGDGTYVFDVTVVSVGLGNKYAASAGSVVGMTNPPPGIIRCENVEDFAVTSPDESNFDVVNSMYRNLGLRNLVSRQSIRAPLYEQFPGILDIYITSSSDEKMVRDRLTVNVNGLPTEIRLGGMSDIWVNTTGVLSRQVQFSYTPSTQKFKLVSEQQASKTELIYSTPHVYLTLDGEFSAPDFLAAQYALNESCEVVFDQGGLMSTSLVATPQYQHRYTLATRDLVLGDSLIVFPSRFTNSNRFVTDVLGIPFDTVQARTGDLAILDGLAHRAAQVSPRVMELTPAATTESSLPPPALFTYSATTPIAAGGLEIPHDFLRSDLLPNPATIDSPGLGFYPGHRVTIVGSSAAGQYRLIDWSDENGDPSGATGVGNYNFKKFFLGNIVAEGELSAPVMITPTTYQYTFNAVGGGAAKFPIDADVNCWIYAHAGADLGVHNPRPISSGGVGDWLRIIKIVRNATSVQITVQGSTALGAHVSVVQGLKGDLVSGTPIYFERDGTASRASTIPTDFDQLNARYTNLTSVQVNPGETIFKSPGLGTVANEGDLLVFSSLSLESSMVALAGNDGSVHWTTTIASIIDDNTVMLGLTPPVSIYAGTAFSLMRNTEVETRFSGASIGVISPAGTNLNATGVGTASAVGDRIAFQVLQERALGANAVTQYAVSISLLGVFVHPGVGQMSTVGDIVSVPSAAYTATVASIFDDNTMILSPVPGSAVGIGVTYSLTRPGTHLQAVVQSVVNANNVTFTPPLRQSIPGATAVTVTRDKLALTSAFVTTASLAALNATLSSLVPSGQSWPLGLGDGSGLPLRITSPRTGKTEYRTIRFSTGGAVRKIEMRAPSQVVPLVMSASKYVAASDSDIGQTVNQKLARQYLAASGTLGVPLPGTWILPRTNIAQTTLIGDTVEFNVSGVFYTAKIVSYPDNNNAQLDGQPSTLLNTAAIAIGGSVTSGGLFSQTGIAAASQVGDTFEFAIAGLPYASNVATLIPANQVQLASPYPSYAIPAGTTYKQYRHATPGSGSTFTVWRPDRSTSYVGTLRSFDNSTRTWYVEPNDPARDVFVVDPLSSVSVANKQELNYIAATGATQPFGYVDPIFGDIGLIVRQGAYQGILTGYNGRNWEVKPLTDQDLFDDTSATTFVDYLATGRHGTHGYGKAASAASMSLLHTTGTTAITMEATFPFEVVAVPSDTEPDDVAACVVEVLSRNGRTGFIGVSQSARTMPDLVISPDTWASADPATEQMLVLNGTSVGSYLISTADPNRLNVTSSLESIYARLPNVLVNQKVTPPTFMPAGVLKVGFPGSLIGAWGHHGRVLHLTVNGTEYFNAIDYPVDGDTVMLVASEPTQVPLSSNDSILVEVVDGFISPAVRILTANVESYRLVRAPTVLEPVTMPVKGMNGTEDPSFDQFIDGVQDFGLAIGGYDPTGTVRDAWLALDTGNDASLVPKAVTSVISSTAIGIEPNALISAVSNVHYRLLHRPGWLAMESWAPATIVNGSHIDVLKTDLPAGWAWKRNDTFGQWNLHIIRDGRTDGPVVATPAWELPHIRIVGVVDNGTYWRVQVDVPNANGLNYVTGVFQYTSGFQAGWHGRQVRFMLRILDRMMVRNVRANGVETYNYYNGPKFILPVVRILAVELVDAATQQPVGPVNYDLVVTDAGLRYSAREVNQLVLTDPGLHLKPIRVTYLCDATIEAMDNFVNNDDVRVLNCNQVVKRMETIAVDLQVQVKSTRSQSELIQLLASYINTLPSTARISKDGIVQFLYSQRAVTYINMSFMRLDGFYYPSENGVPVEYLNVDEVFGAATAAYIAGLISVTLVTA